MYTWGYIKTITLAKLDLTEDEAQRHHLIDKFKYYANEAIVQISSTIKPNNTFAEFCVVDNPEDVSTGKILVGTQVKMPKDFIAFGDDINERTYEQYNMSITESASDEDFKYVGYNRLMFKKPGTYQISYKALWYDFSNVNPYDALEIDVPHDILDCISPYIASQCFKIDDLEKAQIYRNEYELALARIDDTDFRNTKTFTIGGDW